MAQWPDAVEQSLARVRAVLAGQGSLLPAEAADLHPCTDCTKLNVGGFCAHYQKVLPEPAVPNACVHFESRLPDVPWQ